MLPVFSSLFLLHFRNPHAYYLELENQTFFFSRCSRVSSEKGSPLKKATLQSYIPTVSKSLECYSGVTWFSPSV